VRSELFSAAAVFYFILSGHAPFESTHLPKVLHAVIHNDPPPLTDDQAPEALRRVILKALAKAPDERYQRCSDLLADLEQVRSGSAGAAPRAAAARERRPTRKLIVTNGEAERELLLVGTMVVGRDPACDVSDVDPLLSRRHAEFTATANAVSVRDLGSRNGI